ncbi:MAG: DUF2259 domain-containing protein, partial [Myxococcota bacterium]
QDGSGFPYSNIYLIDTATDSWVDGTPIRVLTEGDAPPLAETRSQAADRFRPFLIEHRIGADGIGQGRLDAAARRARSHVVLIAGAQVDAPPWIARKPSS